MATRFYLPSAGTPPASPTISAEWEHSNGVRFPMSISKTATGLSAVTYAPDAVDHLVDNDSLFFQYISIETLAAQTIAAAGITLVMQASESNALNHLFLTWKVFVCSGDGATIKETLIAIQRDGTELTTTVTNRNDAGTIILANVEAGDRLVLEIGIGGLPTAGSGVNCHNGKLQPGDQEATDLAADDTDTGTTKNPWLEFANTLTFQSASLAVSDTIGLGIIPFPR